MKLCYDCGLLKIPDELTHCPECGCTLYGKMCVCDFPCTCSHTMHGSIKFCKVCGKPICPDCGSSDVVAISRVTGYLQSVDGWNSGKRQELKDRVRTVVP